VRVLEKSDAEKYPKMRLADNVLFFWHTNISKRLKHNDADKKSNGTFRPSVSVNAPKVGAKKISSTAQVL
jgi:hypothetical protein